jgi:ABC-type sugar transport system permease subunit
MHYTPPAVSTNEVWVWFVCMMLILLAGVSRRRRDD